jgi:crossover junction endodeoxyribonuclease RuvC
VRILGIDPGTARMGWGVIDANKKAIKHVAVGCFTTSKDDTDSVRLASLVRQIKVILKEYKPEVAVVESLFFFRNTTTAMRVAEARGAVIAVLGEQKMPVHEYTPLEIKLSLVGYGRAEKKEVEEAVLLRLKIKEKIKPDDAIDALAAAITHVNGKPRTIREAKAKAAKKLKAAKG